MLMTCCSTVRLLEYLRRILLMKEEDPRKGEERRVRHTVAVVYRTTYEYNHTPPVPQYQKVPSKLRYFALGMTLLASDG